MTEFGFKPCLKCRKEFEPEDLFTIYLDGFFVDMCRTCISKATKSDVRELIQSDDAFLKKRLQRSRYLFCPVCKSNKIETEFVVMVIVDEVNDLGLDGLIVCRSCFKDKFEKKYTTPEEIEKTVKTGSVTMTEIATTTQMTTLDTYHQLLDKLSPRIPQEKFECRICECEFITRDMPFIIAYKIEKGKVLKNSGKICLECYRKLWLATTERGIKSSIYDIVHEALVKLADI